MEVMFTQREAFNTAPWGTPWRRCHGAPELRWAPELLGTARAWVQQLLSHCATGQVGPVGGPWGGHAGKAMEKTMGKRGFRWF